MKLTPEEIRREWFYRKEERLGMLCGATDPTPEQIAIAVTEADEWRQRYNRQENGELFYSC